MQRSLTLGLTGDVMLGRLVAEASAERGFASPWGDMLPVLEAVDLLLINLECCLTDLTAETRPEPGKAFHFRAEPSAAATLRAGRVAFTSLANNHIADFGMEGLMATVRTLDCAGIRHAGAGANLREARAPAVLTAAGCRIAVVACADYPAAWVAAPTRPGIFHVDVPEGIAELEQVVGDARRQADLVIVSIHWGPNMRVRPTPAFRAFAHRAIEAGADVFWGHSAHLVQGVEFWRDRPILYDTGDFVDDYHVDPELRNDLSALFLLRVRPPRVERVEVLPVQIRDMRVHRALGAERDRFVRRFTGLCAELGTTVVPTADDDTLALT